MICFVLGVCALTFFAWLTIGVRHIGKLSSGTIIKPRRGKAILLIDLQTVFWESGIYNDDIKSKMAAKIAEHLHIAKNEGTPIIAIRQEWSEPVTKMIARLFMKGAAIAGSPGTELATPFTNDVSYHLTKRVQDAFETGELDTLLGNLDVGSLEIMGLDGEYCVARTVESAINRGYKVRLIEDGIATARVDKFETIKQHLKSKGALI